MSKSSDRAERRRKRLFSAYGSNLVQYEKAHGLWTGNEHDQQTVALKHLKYVCPLCLSVFEGTHHVRGSNPALTEEHNPPKKYHRGHGTLLTCKRCNNESGPHDKVLGAYLESRPSYLSKTGRPYPIQLKVRNSHLRAIAKQEGGNTTITIDSKVSGYLWKAFHQDYAKPGNHMLRFRDEPFDSPAMKRTLLRIAHLQAFQYLGYDYLFSKNGEFIRTVVGGTSPMNRFGGVAAELQNHSDGLHYLIFGKRKAFLSVFTLKTINDEHRCALMIPGYGEAALENYMALQSEPVEGEAICVSFNRKTLPDNQISGREYELFWESIQRTEYQPSRSSVLVQ